MIFTPGSPEHIVELVRAYAAFEQVVRDLTELDAEHAADVARALHALDANVVKLPRGELEKAIAALRASDALLFERAPLGQHLLRLTLAVNPHLTDVQHMAATVDRMSASVKRRAAYACIKRLQHEGKPVPSPQPDDSNAACLIAARARTVEAQRAEQAKRQQQANHAGFTSPKIGAEPQLLPLPPTKAQEKS